MKPTELFAARTEANIVAFRKQERKDSLDKAVVASLNLQIAALTAHSALPIDARARYRAAQAYLIARGALAVISQRWNYNFADEEVRPFLNQSPLLWEFDERVRDCKTRDQTATLLERYLGNVRQILDEPAVRAGREQTAA